MRICEEFRVGVLREEILKKGQEGPVSIDKEQDSVVGYVPHVLVRGYFHSTTFFGFWTRIFVGISWVTTQIDVKDGLGTRKGRDCEEEEVERFLSGLWIKVDLEVCAER